MGICAVCNNKTGFFRGKNEFNGKEYCGSCFSQYVYKYKKGINEEYLSKYNVPKDSLTVRYNSGYIKMPKIKYYVWKADNNLCFFPEGIREKEEYILYQIALEQIEYYATRGEVHRETKISGGGGTIGGSSITGAVLGAMVAGGTGAVIGSRKEGKIEQIKSEIITHDERETFLNYYVDKVRHSLFFDYYDYNILLKLIPTKAYGNHQSQYSVKPIISNLQNNTQHNNLETIKQIRELSVLKDEGIITQEEFNEKKKLLMDKIK
jgi:hypothetical protein